MVVPKPAEVHSTGLKATLDSLKADNRVQNEFEPQLVSCLMQVYQDCKSLYGFLDTLKNSYVVDNTKLIELEEAVYQ